MSDMQTIVGWLVVVPEHMTGSSVDSPDIIRDREIQDAVNKEWRRFDRSILVSLERPRQSETSHILWVDLSEMAMPLAGIISMVGRPTVWRRMSDGRELKILRQQ